MTTQEIFQAALALPPEAREQLVQELQSSLIEDPDDFIEMLNRRGAAVVAGEPGSPAAEVFARLRARG